MRTKISLAVMGLSSLLISCNTQSKKVPTDIEWQAAFSGSDWKMEQTNDGGFIIAGIKATADNHKAGKYGEKGDYCIAKIDKKGKLEWQKALGDYESQGVAAITITSDNGYILISTNLTQYRDLEKWIIKLDKKGEIQWKKAIENWVSDIQQVSDGGYNWASDIQQTSDGGYIITGKTMSVSEWETRRDDYWVAKLDAKGDLAWQKVYGGSEFDVANSIEQTLDGGYIIAGYTGSSDGDVSNKIGGKYNLDYWIVKLNKDGNIQWEKTYGGTNEDIANSIQQTKDGGYIVAGSSKSRDGDITNGYDDDTYADYWVVKLDGNGEKQWQKNYGGAHSDYANSIQQTRDGGYIIAGWSNSNTGDKPDSYSGKPDYWIVKTDKEGILQWQKTLGGTERDEATFIRQTKDGGYLVAGNSGSNDGDVDTSKGTQNVWVVKLK